MFKNYYELTRACNSYQAKFDLLLVTLTVSYIETYFKKTKKIMPLKTAHFLAYRTITKLIKKKWLDENLDFVDPNFQIADFTKRKEA